MRTSLLRRRGRATATAAGAAFSSASAGAGEGGDVTVSHTVSGANRYLLVVAALDVDPGVGLECAYGGAPLAMLDAAEGGPSAYVAAFGLVAPASGTADVVLTGTGGNFAAVCVLSFTGINQGSPTAAADTGTGTSDSPSVTASSAAGEIVVGGVAIAPALAATPGAGQAERGTAQADVLVLGAASTEPGAVSVVTSWSLAASRDWAVVAVPLKPA